MENMESIINRIIGIEERAQDIASDAKKMKSSLKSDIEKEAEIIRADIKNKVAEKYEAIADFELEYADKRIKEISRNYENAEKNLEETYKNKKEEWVKSVYNDIIGTV